MFYIRLQNLPLSAGIKDVRHFFSGIDIPEGHVQIIGGERGDVFIGFRSYVDASQAMLKNGGEIHEVQIEITPSSRAEVLDTIEMMKHQSQCPTIQNQAAAPAEQSMMPPLQNLVVAIMASEHLSVSLSQSLKSVENENSYPPLHRLGGKLPLRERNNLYLRPDIKRDRSRSPVQKKNVEVEQRNDCLRRDHRHYDESAQYRVNATRHTNDDMNHKDLYHQIDNPTDPFNCFGMKENRETESLADSCLNSMLYPTVSCEQMPPTSKEQLSNQFEKEKNISQMVYNDKCASTYRSTFPPSLPEISSEVIDEIGKDISFNDEKCGVPPNAVEISGVPRDVTMKEILDLFPNIKIPAANICIIASYKDTEKVLIRFKHPNECEQVLNYQPYYIRNFLCKVSACSLESSESVASTLNPCKKNGPQEDDLVLPLSGKMSGILQRPPAILPSPQPVSILQTPPNHERPLRRPLLSQVPNRERFEDYHPHPSEKMDFHPTFNGLDPTRGPHFSHGWRPGFPRGGCSSIDGPFNGDRPPMMRHPSGRMHGHFFNRPPFNGHLSQTNGPAGFGAPGCVVSINNLHFRASLENILEFFKEYNLSKDNVIRRFNENRQVTGEARVAFRSPWDAQRAVTELNHKSIMGRSLSLALL